MSVPVGYIAVGTVGYTDKGDYDTYTTYNRFNTVLYNACTWVAKHDGVVGIPPEEGEHWHLMARGFTLVLDPIPINGSENPVMSGGVYTELKKLQDGKQVKFRYVLENQEINFITNEFIIINADITPTTHVQVYFRDNSIEAATRAKIDVFTDTGRIIFRAKKIPTQGTSSVPLYCDIIYDKTYVANG